MIFKYLITFYTKFCFGFYNFNADGLFGICLFNCRDILLLWHIVWQGSAVLAAGAGLTGLTGCCVCVCVFFSSILFFFYCRSNPTAVVIYYQRRALLVLVTHLKGLSLPRNGVTDNRPA